MSLTPAYLYGSFRTAASPTALRKQWPIGYRFLGRRLGELRGLRGGALPFVGSILFSALGLGLQLLACRVAMVGFVETLKRGIGCVMAVVLGRLVLGGPVGGRKVAAIAAMAPGVALILLP